MLHCALKPRVSRPQSNGIVERLHRTPLDEHFRVEGRKTWFETIEEMQTVLDDNLTSYTTRRPHRVPHRHSQDSTEGGQSRSEDCPLTPVRERQLSGDIHL